MAKNIVKVLTSNFLLVIVGLINSFVFPIILSINDYAFYQQYNLYIAYINICHLGIASGMFLNYGGKKYEDTDKSIYKSEISLILIVLTFFTTAGFVADVFAKNVLVLMITLSIYPVCITASFLALYQAWNKFNEYSVINAAPKIVITATAAAIYILTKKLTGSTIVCIYIGIQYLTTALILGDYLKFTKGAVSDPIFSNRNLKTTISGFLITAGNYVNVLFQTIDKQFVNVFCSTYDFAMYSFAMSTQGIMTIFITSIALPFYPKLAQCEFSRTQYKTLKEMLFIFGSSSGCAFFIVSFIVQAFITKYIDCLQVVKVFFVVFPAMAVINVIYINLYKLRKMIYKYIITLIGVVGVSAILNTLAMFLKAGMMGIAFATMLVYYVWMFYSQRDFPEASIGKKDCLYLAAFFFLYFSCVNLKNSILGFILYTFLILVVNYTFYHQSMQSILKVILLKGKWNKP